MGGGCLLPACISPGLKSPPYMLLERLVWAVKRCERSGNCAWWTLVQARLWMADAEQQQCMRL